jgi:5-formyltetrahydrofolate cyclo-ligase
MQTTHGGPATPDKSELRKAFRAARKAHVQGLSAAERQAREQALAGIAAPLVTLPGPLASYAGVGDEIDPVHVEKLFGPHAFPRIRGRDLNFHMADWADLVPGPLRIPQPRADAPEVTPRLLLVPLIAATRTGLRLGQGGGYYDRTLARLRAAAPTIAIGLAWDVQLTDHLPAEPHDQRLDWIATPTQLVDCHWNR